MHTIFFYYLNEEGMAGTDTTFPSFQSTVIVLTAPVHPLK